MKDQNQELKSASARGFEYVKRVALSGPGKLLLAVAVVGSLMSLPQPTGACDRNDADAAGDRIERGDGREILQGFAIAPVPLDLRGKNWKLVGLGSYIVNAQGGCNDCHTTPTYAPGHDPHRGQPKQVNVATYLGGYEYLRSIPSLAGPGPRE